VGKGDSLQHRAAGATLRQAVHRSLHDGWTEADPRGAKSGVEECEADKSGQRRSDILLTGRQQAAHECTNRAQYGTGLELAEGVGAVGGENGRTALHGDDSADATR
jgi:hypothetical protein